MGVKRMRKVANELREIATAEGVRVGFVVLEEDGKAMAFSTYKGEKDARMGLIVLKDILTKMKRDEE